MAHRSRTRDRGSNTRRRFLFTVGAGAAGLLGVAAAASETGAFSAVAGDRTSSVGAANKGEGIVGIAAQDTVQKNSRDPLIEFDNTYTEDVTITVSLNTCSDGTLYDPAGNSGCSVTYTMPKGNNDWFDLEAAVQGDILYSVSVTAPNLDLSVPTKSVESQTGNKPGAVDIRSPSKDQDFEAFPKKDQFEVKTIDVRDNDGDNDLDRIEMEVTRNSDGTLVAAQTISSIPGDRYAPGGQPDAVLDSDDFTDDFNGDVTNGTVYNLDFKAYDADGNFASVSIDDDA